jgi:prepilin-type N-terminal cleavage/methylation domain-containing protein
MICALEHRGTRPAHHIGNQENPRMLRRPGFTFIEILIAMTVFGILTTVAVPRYRLFKERAYMASMKSELGSLRVAQEAFWAENLAYATDTTLLDWNGSGDVRLALASSDPSGGFSATATHVLAPNLSCATFVGREASTTASGDIICTAVGGGSSAGVTP